MTANLRHPEILALARSEGKVTVDELASTLGVTLQTIRRDLADLSAAGVLDRVHGGAVLPSGTQNIAYEERRRLNDASKARIGAACAALIPNDICLFLSIGTTSEAVARALSEHVGLMVVTNNINIAQILAPHPNLQVVMTGGRLRHADGGLTGPLSQSALEQFRFDIAVIGCSAIDGRGTLLDFDMDEVRGLQSVLKSALETCLVADASKFARHAPMAIAPITQAGRIITDAPLKPSLAEVCAQSQTDVIVA